MSAQVLTNRRESPDSTCEYGQQGNRASEENMITIINSGEMRVTGTEAVSLHERVELMALTLVQNKQRINIVNLYIEPRATERDLTELYEYLKTHCLLKRTVIIGDFNAHLNSTINRHDTSNPMASKNGQAHYTEVKGKRAQLIRQFCLQEGLRAVIFENHNEGTLVDKASSLHGNKEVRVDGALVGKSIIKWWNLIKTLEATKDHRPIFLYNINKINKSLSRWRIIKTYKIWKINKGMFLELDILARKLANNWQTGEQDVIIKSLNILTEATIEALLNSQSKVMISRKVRIANDGCEDQSINGRAERILVQLEYCRNKMKRLKHKIRLHA